MASILVSQFEMVGMDFGTRIVSSLFSKFGRPATIRLNRAKQKVRQQEIDVKSECRNLQEKGLITINPTCRFELTEEGREKAAEFDKNLKKSRYSRGPISQFICCSAQHNYYRFFSCRIEAFFWHFQWQCWTPSRRC
jgi:hypothetical protein